MSDKQPLPTGVQLTAADPVFREHPHEYLDRLRTEDPVHRDAKLRRLFLTRFEEARVVVSNRALSVDPRKAPPDSYLRRILAANEPIELFEPSMLSLDDAHHKRIRGLVSQAFNQRAVDAFRPRIRAIAEALLDPVEHIGQLRGADRDRPVSRRRPDEATALQALGVERHADAVMPDDLNEVASGTSEDV